MNVRDLYRNYFQSQRAAFQEIARRAWQQTPIAQIAQGMTREALEQRAREAWKSTPIAQALQAVQAGGERQLRAQLLRASKAMLGSRFGGALAAAKAKQIKSTQQFRDQLVRAFTRALGPQFGGAVSVLIQYAKRKQDPQGLVQSFFDALGPFGDILRALIAPEQHELPDDTIGRQIQAAMAFLSAYGYEVIPSREARKPAEEWGRLPRGIERKPGRRTVDVPMAHGPPQRVPVDDPLVTGEFVPARASSNVHSYAYDYERGRLYIRFLGHTRRGDRRGPGPLYAYVNVEPELFRELQRAASKGSWVWDRLRIRGTISGHQYDYQLVATTHGYVPRKATLTAAGEAYMPRTLAVPGGKWLSSTKPFQVVRPLTPNVPR